MFYQLSHNFISHVTFMSIFFFITKSHKTYFFFSFTDINEKKHQNQSGVNQLNWILALLEIKHQY